MAARAWAKLNRGQRDGKAKDGMLAEIRPPSGLLDAARAGAVADLFKALADPTRIRIISMLLSLINKAIRKEAYKKILTFS